MTYSEAQSRSQTASLTQSRAQRVWVQLSGAAWPLLAVLLLALPLLWFSLVAAPNLRIDVGQWGDHTVLSGINAPEQSATESYRWTMGRTELALPNLSERYRVLAFRAHGWRPDAAPAPLVQLAAGGQPLGTFQTTPEIRQYRILLPDAATGPQLRLSLTSDIYAPAGDGRELGIALDWIALNALGSGGPSFWHLGGQMLLLSLLALLCWALRLPSFGAPLLLALLSALLLLANLSQPLWISQALPHWLIGTLLLLVATWLARPSLHHALVPWMTPRQVRWAWVLFVAALGLRLFGSIHPLFNAHDVDVHMRWLDTVTGGQLYLYSTPGELRNQQTFNPPAGYVLLLPLQLLGLSPRLVVQVGVALVDALGCLLLLPIARELRLSARSGLFALALYAALPINTTMLWWGFATNALAQTGWLLLLWLILWLVRAPSRMLVALVAVVAAINLLMHVGALVLVVAMLGLWALLGWRSAPVAGRRAALGALALAVITTVPLYFSAAAAPILAQPRDAAGFDVGALLAKGWADREIRLWLVSRGFLLAFLAPLLALAPFGIAGLITARERHPLQRSLVVTWVVVCLGFLCVYMSLGFLTRYIYFLAPLVCLGAGLVLAHLSRRATGRFLALALVLLIAWSGTQTWVEGVLLRVKPSVVSLTH